MKKTTKILSLIMLMVVAMALVGCGKKDTSDQLSGTWELTFVYSTLIEDELGSDYADFDEDLFVTVYMTFNEDGTCKRYVDEDELAPQLQAYIESLAQFDANLAYEILESQGYSKAEADEAAQQELGMSLYDFSLSQFSNAVTAADIAGEFYFSGVFEAKGNELHMDEYQVEDNVFDEFKVEGNTLTLNPPTGGEYEETGIEGYDYPFVFTKSAQ